MTTQAAATMNTPATSMPASLRSFTDAAADAVARAIATVQREALRERELRDAQFAARMAELEVRIAAVADLERRLADRLATLKDGEPGRDGVDGTNGSDGTNGADGRDGTSVTVEDVVPLLIPEAERVAAETAERIISTWERPQDGRSITPEEMAPLVEETVQRAVAALPVPADGRDGADGKDGEKGEQGPQGDRGEPGPAGNDGRDGACGQAGERGPEGPAGKMPIARAWVDGVHYEGDIVTHAGATYQATKDTGRKPPSDDWLCLASAGTNGADGRSFTIRGTWAEGEEYHALDVVALGGASFAARKDDPGQCPGEGWQLIAARGKRGNPGERGPSVKGDRGLPGPTVASMLIRDDGLLILTNADGSTATCDLYPILSKLG